MGFRNSAIKAMGYMAIATTLLLTLQKPAQADATLVFDGSEYTGIDNLDINGALYDVEFDDFAFSQLTAGNSILLPAGPSYNTAMNEILSLIEATFGSANDLDSNPSLMRGCEPAGPYSSGSCTAFTLLSGFSLTGVINNLPGEANTVVDPFDVSDDDYFDIVGYPGVTQMRFTPVPIPAALPLFSSALGVLGFMSWRKRKQT